MSFMLLYQSPVSEVLEIETEGLLCTSPGNEGVGENEGNGGFEYN